MFDAPRAESIKPGDFSAFFRESDKTRATLRLVSCDACRRIYRSSASELQQNRERSCGCASASMVKVTPRPSL